MVTLGRTQKTVLLLLMFIILYFPLRHGQFHYKKNPLLYKQDILLR